MIELLPDRHCESGVNALLPSFCFGELSDEEREAVIQHVLACDVCWAEVRRLEAAVAALRMSPEIAPLPLTAEAIAVVKLSGKQEHAFGGHLAFALSAAALHASLYTASVWTELGYSYDRFGGLALLLSPIVFAAMLAATLLSFWAGAFFSKGHRRTGLQVSAALLLVSVAALSAGLATVLPSEPTIAATFTTRSAIDGYLKNVAMYFFPAGVVYLLVPWHVVVGLERELTEGRVKNTLDLLSGTPSAFYPRGVWFVRPLMLGMLLIPAVWIGYSGTHHMLDALTPGPYANLFSRALLLRASLSFAVALLGFLWFQRRLQDLKQHAALMHRLMS